MRLVDFGTGEVVDRLTILNLKVLFGREKGVDVSHFEREQTALLSKIRSKTLNGPWFHLTLELSGVNAALWHAEDDLREWREKLRKTPPDSTGLSGPGSGYLAATAPTVIDLSFRIQALNDRRADLIAAINKEAGDGEAVEKV